MANQHAIPNEGTDMLTGHDFQGTRHLLPPISSFVHRPTAPSICSGNYETFTIASDPNSRSADVLPPLPTNIQHLYYHNPLSERPSAHAGATCQSTRSRYLAARQEPLPTFSDWEPASYRTSNRFGFGPYNSTWQVAAQSNPGSQRTTQSDSRDYFPGSLSATQPNFGEPIFNSHNPTRHCPSEPTFGCWSSSMYIHNRLPTDLAHRSTNASLLPERAQTFPTWRPQVEQQVVTWRPINSRYTFGQDSDIAMQDHQEFMREYAEAMHEAHSGDLYGHSISCSNNNPLISEPIGNEDGMSDDDSHGISGDDNYGMSDDDSNEMSDNDSQRMLDDDQQEMSDESDGTLLGDDYYADDEDSDDNEETQKDTTGKIEED